MHRTLIAILVFACLGLLPAATRASVIVNPVVTASGSALDSMLGVLSFTWPQTSVHVGISSASVTESDSPLQLTATSRSNSGGNNYAHSILRITFQFADDTPYDLSVTTNFQNFVPAFPTILPGAYGWLDGTIGYHATDASSGSYEYQGVLPVGTHYLEVHTGLGQFDRGDLQVSATFTVVPEPASISLLFLGTLLTLRRPSRHSGRFGAEAVNLVQP